MKVFFFQIEAVPQPDNTYLADLGGANIHLWVMGKTKEAAFIRATHYISEYGWEVKEVKSAFVPTQEQLAALARPEYTNYLKARGLGISAFFGAWPKIARPGGFEYRPIEAPDNA